MLVRGIRGAITVKENEPQTILQATSRLLNTMISKNGIHPDFVASVFISSTDDISTAFPAKAMRELHGWTQVPVMCMQEMSVPESLPFCIRIMIHLNTEKPQDEINHIYLEDAITLRPDLAKDSMK